MDGYQTPFIVPFTHRSKPDTALARPAPHHIPAGGHLKNRHHCKRGKTASAVPNRDQVCQDWQTSANRGMISWQHWPAARRIQQQPQRLLDDDGRSAAPPTLPWGALVSPQNHPSYPRDPLLPWGPPQSTLGTTPSTLVWSPGYYGWFLGTPRHPKSACPRFSGLAPDPQNAELSTVMTVLTASDPPLPASVHGPHKSKSCRVPFCNRVLSGASNVHPPNPCLRPERTIHRR